MATAAFSIAPVLTPRTVGVLADLFERDHLMEPALTFRKLEPFVQGVVKRYFVPLFAQSKRGTFTSRFNRLSRDFEPFRLHLNSRILLALPNQPFLELYEQLLRDILGPLMNTAREMDMAPELISAVIRDYSKILRALVQPVSADASIGSDPTVEQFENLIDWIHAATRLDYGLTAVFLVLEGTIPTPHPTQKVALLSACKNTLIGFVRATSNFAVHEHIYVALQDLATPNIEVTIEGKRVQVVPSLELNQDQRRTAIWSSPRQSEIDWLKRHKDLSERYGGRWIVLEKDELVASETDYRKAREAAVRRGIKRPFIIFVPLKEVGGFMGI
jgi:hypothetical protein